MLAATRGLPRERASAQWNSEPSGLAGSSARPVVLDGGLQRYYTVGFHEPTCWLLGNVVPLLGLVGCKSEVPR